MCTFPRQQDKLFSFVHLSFTIFTNCAFSGILFQWNGFSWRTYLDLNEWKMRWLVFSFGMGFCYFVRAYSYICLIWRNLLFKWADVVSYLLQWLINIVYSTQHILLLAKNRRVFRRCSSCFLWINGLFLRIISLVLLVLR